MLGHKTLCETKHRHLNESWEIEIIQSTPSDNNGMNLEINSKSKIRKFTNTWKLKYTPLNNEWIKEEITGKIRKYLETNENKNTGILGRWCNRRSCDNFLPHTPWGTNHLWCNSLWKWPKDWQEQLLMTANDPPQLMTLRRVKEAETLLGIQTFTICLTHKWK